MAPVWRFWQPRGAAANILFSLKSNPFCASFFRGVARQEIAMRMSETEMMLKGYGLTTAEMFYRIPDYQSVLNTFIWQDYDTAPDHPRLFRFIEFWRDEIEGPLHSVRFTHRKMISPGEWRNVTGEFTLH
jgi:uncharacterized protein Usg